MTRQSGSDICDSTVPLRSCQAFPQVALAEQDARRRKGGRLRHRSPRILDR